jgi:hypothetical protein
VVIDAIPDAYEGKVSEDGISITGTQRSSSYQGITGKPVDVLTAVKPEFLVIRSK